MWQENQSRMDRRDWPDRFYLRVGLGRKATGSFYTPHSFVRFLVHETLGPLVASGQPPDDPQPGAILRLKVIDKAMGSGHFLVESCRFLGQPFMKPVAVATNLPPPPKNSPPKRPRRKEDREAARPGPKFRQRVIDLPDPDDELLRYLPSRSVEGDQPGVSHDGPLHFAAAWSPSTASTAWIRIRWPSNWRNWRSGSNVMPRACRSRSSTTGSLWAIRSPARSAKAQSRCSAAPEPLQDLSPGLTSRAKAAGRSLQCVRPLEATVGITLAEIEPSRR